MLGDGKTFEFKDIYESINKAVAKRMYDTVYMYATHGLVQEEIRQLRRNMPLIRKEDQRIREMKLVAEDIEKMNVHLVGFDILPVDGTKVFVFDSKEHPAEDWGMKSVLIEELGTPPRRTIKISHPLGDYLTDESIVIEEGDEVQILDKEGNTTVVPSAIVHTVSTTEPSGVLAVEITGSVDEDKMEWYDEDSNQIVLLKKKNESKTNEVSNTWPKGHIHTPQKYIDEEGDWVHVLQDVEFTDINNTVIDALEAGYEEFLYGGLGSDEGITNTDRTKIFWGADVQDVLRSRNESKTNEADEVDRHEAEQTMKPQEDDTEVLPPDHMEDYSPEGEEEKGSKSKGTDNELKEIPDTKLDHEVKYESTGPLFLCNACFKTFRNSSESRCTKCESINVDRLVEEVVNPDKERLEELQDVVDTAMQDKYPGMGVDDVLDVVVSKAGEITSDDRTEITRYIESVIDESKLKEAEAELKIGTRFNHEGQIWRVEDVGETQSKVQCETEEASGENIFVDNKTILRNAIGKMGEAEQADVLSPRIIAAYEKARANGKSREEATQRAVKAAQGSVEPSEIRNLLMKKGVDTVEIPTESKVDEEKGEVGFTKKVFAVTFTKDGKEEKTRYMGFDETAVRKEMEKNPKVKVLTVKKVAESTGNFSQSRKGTRTVSEAVVELIGETPGILKEDQEVLQWALKTGVIPTEFPDEEVMMDHLSFSEEMRTKQVAFKDMGLQDPEGLDLGSIEAVYLKYVLLPKAQEAFEEKSSEFRTSEKLSVGALKNTQAPVLTFDYQTAAIPEEIMKDLAQTDYFQRSMVGSRIRLVNAKGTTVTFAKDDDQEWKEWSDEYGFLIETRYNVWYRDKKDPKSSPRKFGDYGVVSGSPSAAKKHVRDTLDDEEPGNKYEIVNVELYKKDESKLKEEDEYSVAGKGIEDEQAAKDLARDKKGQVVPDAEDDKKWQVIVRKGTV